MPLTIVTHTTTEPALFGALAAAVAHRQDAELLHLPSDFAPALGADAVQWVAAAGALIPSGLLWYERFTGRQASRASSPQAIVEAARAHPIIVPWHPGVQNENDLSHLRTLAIAQGVEVHELSVEQSAGGWYLLEPDCTPAPYGLWYRDRFGRLVSTPAPTLPEADRPLRIALVGAYTVQLHVYPATLAALGDAIDALGLSVSVDFVDPRQLDMNVLEQACGILLPGGSDMVNVPGQLLAARHALDSGTPCVGLCLGMQTMVTALARTLPESREANLDEAEPGAPIKSFVPMADTPGLPVYRLGTQRLSIADERFATLLGEPAQVRCNHRYQLNPELAKVLVEHGMRITATDESGQIIDAIAYPPHPFYMGMQGHPEQSSRASQPHPLLSAFLEAAGHRAPQK